MNAEESFRGWCCTDCLFLLANGETPTDWSDVGLADYLNSVEQNTAGFHVALGGEHSEGCPNVAPDGSWVGSTDCDCEHREFSWSSCDVCGSTLGGSRDAVTFFALEDGR